MAPADTPDWVHDRETLWNRVEECERRKDAQLARIIELGLPVELSSEQSLTLVRDYVATIFVSKGMIADIGIRYDNPHNPRAHVLLTLRDVNAAGFGPKARRWNGRANLLDWRAAWAERTNEHLARAGHVVRIDHRTLEAQQVELDPGRRMGVGRPAVDRIAEQRQIAARNGAAMHDDPALAVRSLAQHRPTFTAGDLSQFLRSRTSGAAQLAAVHAAVMQCAELVAVQSGPDAEPRFTARHLVEAARSLRQRMVAMAARRRQTLWPPGGFSDELRQALDYVMGGGDAKVLVLGHTLDKSDLLAALQPACEADGMQLVCVTPSTLPACLARWQRGSELPARTTFLVVDAAEMIGLKPLERLLSFAEKARGKVVLLADSLRLDALQAQSPLWEFRTLAIHSSTTRSSEVSGMPPFSSTTE